MPPGAWQDNRGWLKVRWTFPLDQLESTAEWGYRTQLRSLLPVKQYSLNITRDSDAPWVFKDDPTKVYDLPFTRNSSKTATHFGSCGTGLVDSRQPPAKPAS